MSETPCRFSILVKRPGGMVTPEETTQMSEKARKYWSKYSDPTTYIQVEDASGNVRNFVFYLGRLDAIFLKETEDPESPAFSCANAGKLLAGKWGMANERKTARCYDERLDYAISEEKYNAILKELTDGKTRYYNTLLYNCSGYAVDIARRNGLDAPPCKMMTPMKLSKYIQALAEEQHRTHQEFAEADQKMGTLFSKTKEAPIPSPQQGIATTLSDRLKTDQTLGLG